jgi:hypothetical protein
MAELHCLPPIPGVPKEPERGIEQKHGLHCHALMSPGIAGFDVLPALNGGACATHLVTRSPA